MEVIAMVFIRNTSRYFVLGFILAAMSGIMVFGFTQAVSAQERGPREPAVSAPRSQHAPSYRDSRYHHNRAYPARGHYVGAVPRDHYSVYHGGVRYRYHGGAWYRPYGPRFAVVAPPFGLVIPFLPLYYTTLWVGGIPYYYANEVYYTQTTGGYMVVEPPKGEVAEAPTSEERLFIYPRKGQSEKQQSNDRYQCHRWAVDQTQFDPTQPPGKPEAQASQKKADYWRAMSACLDARGYTVK
jgi:hypothetical protein